MKTNIFNFVVRILPVILDFIGSILKKKKEEPQKEEDKKEPQED